MGTYALSRKIGLLGGTFDPIHEGHLALALAAQAELGLDQVRFIPCHRPAHRLQPQASAENRLAMVQQALAPYASLVADPCELQRTAPSYTLDTLQYLRASLGHTASFYFLLGVDAFQRIDTWYAWDQLLDFTHLVVVNRPGYNLEAGLSPTLRAWYQHHQASGKTSKPQGSVVRLSVQTPAICASDVRKKLQLNDLESCKALLSPAVIRYIEQSHLYRLP